MAGFLLGIFKALGADPSVHPYFWLSMLIIGSVLYLQWQIGGKLKNIRENVLIVVTHLTTGRKAKLDATLIRAMSPYTIQPAGEKVLEESGFVTAFKNNKDAFFKYVRDMEPKTKLEAERNSITSVVFLLAEGKEFLNPVQIYLYEHPDIRETFPTLAGVYVRDRFFEENHNLV